LGGAVFGAPWEEGQGGAAQAIARDRLEMYPEPRRASEIDERRSDLMKLQPKVVIVLPAYNAAKTLEKTYADIPKDKVSKIILVDDVSQDQTVEVAHALGLSVVIHVQNRGYGGNQKTCYLEALKDGADVVVMLHPDHQ
jgi:cellulose synthase/poly-beta-1,6-N-acetylglucosamine synthase-like glycosyltransferase